MKPTVPVADATRRARDGAMLGAALLLAALVGVAVFVRPYGGRLAQRSLPRATATIVLLPPPSWAPASVPASFLQLPNSGNFAVAPSDGDVAYACMPLDAIAGGVRVPYPQSPLIWISGDRGLSWTLRTSLPVVDFTPTDCDLIVDDQSASTVVATLSTQSNPNDPTTRHSATFFTTDSGTGWRRLNIPGGSEILQLATYGGATYAIRCARPDVPGCFYGGGDYHELVVSSDTFATWHPLTPSLTASGRGIYSFWFGADPSRIFVTAAIPDGNGAVGILVSADFGQTWSELAVPREMQWYVQPPSPGRMPMICGTGFFGSANPALPDSLTCSADGGRTWHLRPMLQPHDVPTGADVDATAAPNQPSGAIAVVGLTDSGDILAEDSYSDISAALLYRLAPGADTWQLLGPLPAGHAFYTQGSRAGILWTYLYGRPGKQTPFDPTGALFTADYPT